MPKIKPAILGTLNGMILTNENTLLLRTKKYPNGGKFLITGTKRTVKGWSHQLTDVQTGERIKQKDSNDSLWISEVEINKMKIIRL